MTKNMIGTIRNFSGNSEFSNLIHTSFAFITWFTLLVVTISGWSPYLKT